MNRIYFICIFLPIILSNCYKDNDNSIPDEIIIEINQVFIDTKIAGTVIDHNGDKLVNYNLKINDEDYIVEGDNFIISLKEAKQRGQTIYVEKSGKIIGQTTVLLVENDINQLVINSFPNWSNIQSNTKESNISLGFLTADISNTIFQTSNFEHYIGELNISHGLFNFENNITNIGFSNLNDLLVLEPLGGFYFSIKDENNETLSVENKNPIILSLDNIPEKTTSIFHFDNKKEQWTKLIDLDNNTSSITISQSGYYLFAIHDSGIFVSGNVNYEGSHVSYHPIRWSHEHLSNSLITTMNGKWITILPENKSSSLDLVNGCNQTIQQEPITTFKSHIKNYPLDVENINNEYQKLNFKIVNCEGLTENNPSITINESTIYHFENETINTWLTLGCDDISIAGNSSNGSKGPSVPWNSSISESINTLTNCDNHTDGYTYVMIDNQIKLYDSFYFEKKENRSIFTSNDNTFIISIMGQNTGNYEEHQVNILIDDIIFGNQGYYCNCLESEIGCGITECIISKYDDHPLGWITVKIKGNVWMQNLKTNIASYLPVEAVIIHQLN